MEVKYKYTRSYRDRHGKLRIEFRRNGRTIALRGTPGTAEFQQSYDEARAQFARGAEPAAPERIAPASLRWLCVQYFASTEYAQLAPSTQRARRLVLEHILQETLSATSPLQFANCPLARFTSVHVRVLRDRKRAHPEAANIRVKTLRVLFNWALQNEVAHITHNPARDVTRLKIGGDGYHMWTDAERAQFENAHPIGSKARLAYALLLHTGQRRSDIVRLGRQHVHSNALRFTQQKNIRRRPITLELPILPELHAVLSASSTGELTFLVTEYGRPFTAPGFGNWFRDRCNEAGLTHCSAHGLRKAAATIAAENGATAHELMAIFGWLSLKEAERYTRAAEQKKLAQRGMARLVPLKK